MPSNDKISLMTAAVGGDLVGSTSRIEVSSLYTTVPVTLGATLALLRTTMLAGGSGYTATDPVVCGAITSSGALNLGANTVTAGAASFTTGAFSGIVTNTMASVDGFVANAATSSAAIGFLATNSDATGSARFRAKHSTTHFADLIVYGPSHASRADQAWVGGDGSTATTIIQAAGSEAGRFTATQFILGASTFVVTAATGNTVVTGTLAVTGTSTLTGNVGVGGAVDTGVGLIVKNATLTGASHIAIQSSTVFASGATTYGMAFRSDFGTTGGAWTMTTGYSYFIAAPSISNTAVTTIYGLYVANQGQAKSTNAYGVYIAAQSGAATTNIGLYNAGTTHLSNIVGILTAPVASQALTILVNGNLTGTGQIGIVSDVVSSSAATSYLYGAYVRVQTAAAAFTVTTARAVVVATPSLGAASAITTNSGVYVGNQGATGITNAYGVYIEAVSGAATTNIGLYNAGTTRLDGTIGLNTAPLPQYAIRQLSSITTGTTQRGYSMEVTASSGATAAFDGLYILLVNNAATAAQSGIKIDTPVISAGTTSVYGMLVNNQGSASTVNAYGVYIAAQSGAATTNIGLYNAGTTTLVGLLTLNAGASLVAAAGSEKSIKFYSSTTQRWLLSSYSTAESGADAGSPFVIAAYTDAGGFIDFPLTILRAAGGAISTTRPFVVAGGFGCNTKTAQTAYASGGALAAYGAGANGFDSGANASALHAMVVSIRAALVANGIMS